MKKLFFPLALLLFLCGCHSPQNVPSESGEAAEKGIILLTAVRDRDFPLYEKTAGEVAEPEAEKDFRSSCEALEKQWGRIGGIEFLRELRTPLFCSQIFVVEFRNRDSKGNEIIREELFQILWDDPQGTKLLGIRLL